MEEFFFIYIEKWIEKDINLYRIYCQKKTWWCGRSNSKNSPGSRFCPSFILQQSLLLIFLQYIFLFSRFDHMAYFCVHSRASVLYLSRSVLYMRAISGTNGSSGFGSQSNEQIDSKTEKLNKEQNISFIKILQNHGQFLKNFNWFWEYQES